MYWLLAELVCVFVMCYCTYRIGYARGRIDGLMSSFRDTMRLNDLLNEERKKFVKLRNSKNYEEYLKSQNLPSQPNNYAQFQSLDRYSGRFELGDFL